MSREHYNTWTRIKAVLTSPGLYQLAQTIEGHKPVGRPPANPTYVVLTYGVLARILRSGIRVELDLQEKHTWAAARELMTQTIARHGLDLPPPGPRPPRWDHWRWLRNQHLTTDEGLIQLAYAFPEVAVATARRIGQLDSQGRGSLTHPDPTRCIYGDGTLVRPLYRPPNAVLLDNDDGTRTPAYPDPRTGALLTSPPGRYDPDLVLHHGRSGNVLTHGYVCWHTRGSKAYQRIDLAAAHIAAPGAEAATAVQLLRDVHRYAGTGIQAVIYDGALRGVHIDDIMQTYGYLVLAKPHGDPTGQDPVDAPLVQTPTGRRARSYPLGTVTHRLPTGSCAHNLASVGGRVVELDLDEAGDPVVTRALVRRSIKRARRADGRYHFNVGYELDCPSETFTVWLSPHQRESDDISRPEQLRLIPSGDPDALRLYGLRSDAESFHSNYKRSLIVDRAMSLGWRRGLVDLYCFALYNNSLAEYRADEQQEGTSRPRTAQRIARL